MIRLALAAAMLFLTSAVSDEKFDAFAGPTPLAVVIRTDPWLDVIGSDNPTFVLYDDRRVIYLEKASRSKASYRSKQLSPAEFSALEEKLESFVDPTPVPRRLNLAPGWTDMPWSHYYINVRDKRMVTSVYGMDGPPAEIGEAKEGIAPPESLKRLDLFASSVHFDATTEWTPDYLEVMVWPYEYAPEPSIVWPKDWPALDSARAKKRGGGYSIFFPGAEKARLEAFLRTRNPKGAVEIGGRKWAVSVRPVFPSEPIWTAELRR
jgi:hypothetical protein